MKNEPKLKLTPKKLTHTRVSLHLIYFYTFCIFDDAKHINQTNQNERTHTKEGTDRTKQHEMMK